MTSMQMVVTLLTAALALCLVYIAIQAVKAVVARLRRKDKRIDKMQVGLSKAAAVLDWIGLKILAEACHRGAAIDVSGAVEQIEFAVKTAEDKTALVRALTPCCLQLINVAEDYPDLFESVVKAIVKEPKLINRLKQLQLENQAAAAKAKREEQEQAAFEQWQAQAKGSV